MPLISTIIGSLSALVSIWANFRPTSLPIFPIILAGVIGIVYSCSMFSVHYRFFWILIPIGIILLYFTISCFRSVDSDTADHSLEDNKGQPKFCLAICIISGLLCLVFGNTIADFFSNKSVSDLNFGVIYMTSLTQMGVFWFFLTRRSTIEFWGHDNYVQTTLVTSTYLFAATICMYFAGTLNLFVPESSVSYTHVKTMPVTNLPPSGFEMIVQTTGSDSLISVSNEVEVPTNEDVKEPNLDDVIHSPVFEPSEAEIANSVGTIQAEIGSSERSRLDDANEAEQRALNTANGEGVAEVENRYLWASILLYCFWTICQYFWIRKWIQFIRVG